MGYQEDRSKDSKWFSKAVGLLENVQELSYSFKKQLMIVKTDQEDAKKILLHNGFRVTELKGVLYVRGMM